MICDNRGVKMMRFTPPIISCRNHDPMTVVAMEKVVRVIRFGKCSDPLRQIFWTLHCNGYYLKGSCALQYCTLYGLFFLILLIPTTTHQAIANKCPSLRCPFSLPVFSNSSRTHIYCLYRKMTTIIHC